MKFKICLMNNPYNKITKEISLLKSFKADLLELTIEPPEFSIEKVNMNFKKIKGHFKIGHCGNFSFANEDESKRKEAIEDYKKIMDIFSRLSISLISVHPDKGSTRLSKKDVFAYNFSALKELVSHGKKKRITLMVENQPPFPLAKDFVKVFDSIEGLYLLFDIGHAYYLGGDKNVNEFIDLHSSKIKHIHVTDNNGKSDDHLFLGHGKIDFIRYFSQLTKKSHYGCGVSLESYNISGAGKIHVASIDERKLLTRESIDFLKKKVISRGK